MNIDKIIKECPKAFEEMLRSRGIKFKEITSVKWYENTNQFFIVTDDRFAYFIYFRELYDFFDSVGIVAATCLVDDDTFTCVLYKIGEEDIFDYNKKTRTEAEYRAFEKAFEIYEKQLGGV